MTLLVFAVIWIPVVMFVGFLADVLRRCRKRARSFRSRHFVTMTDDDYVSPLRLLWWKHELEALHNDCLRCVVCGRHYGLPLLTLTHELDVHTSPPRWRRLLLFDEPKNLPELVEYCRESR